MPQTHVILWWHHHQPWYLDPVTFHAHLPWVRLHACRGYLDMATAAAHPSADRVKHTFNLVPSLLDQLQRYSQAQHSDLWLDLCTPHPADLDAADVATLRLRLGGSGPTPVTPLPRLVALREAIAHDQPLNAQDLLDLQVLAHLGFCGWTLAERPGAVRSLLEKGQGFTQQEKCSLLAETRGVCAEVVQAYRALAAANRVEITVTPYYHPILPLLVDSDVMAEGLPHHARPPRYQFPQDATEQVRRALVCAEQMLGVRPAGMWPAEGSVSTGAVALLGAQGVGFAGTDEGVLYRSSAHPGRTLDHGEPWWDPSGKVAMFFRDHGVSDLIGFTYRNQPANDAAEDFVTRARAFGQQREGRGAPPVMTVILDGENPWEHYAVAGKDHLLALQQALSSASDLRVVTPSQHLQAHLPRGRLRHLHAGSWIDATFAIWIGHAEDRLGWRLLGDCRRAVERAAQAGADPKQVALALERLYAAQGSDWFWWFGEEFHAAEADLYDGLFRQQIRGAYDALGLEAPAALDVPIKRAPADGPTAELLTGWPVDPVLDAATPNPVRWAGAVKLDAPAQGAMARAAAGFSQVWLGTTDEALWVYAAFQDPTAAPAGVVNVQLRGAVDAQLQVSLPRANATEAQTAVGQGLTVCWPHNKTGLHAGDVVEVEVVLAGHGGPPQRFPGEGSARVEVPNEVERWRAAWA